ncbi:MAG TPA: helix-turn-helix domain-containing protein [Solirubrobacterales bacterium]
MQSITAIAPTHASRGEIAEIVARMTTELDEIAGSLTDSIHEHIDELDSDLRVWTLQSVRANLGMMMTMLREGSDPRSAVAPPEAVAYAKEYVLRELDFSLLQRAYRTAQGAFSGMALERLRATTDDVDLLTEAMGFFNAWLFAWIETLDRQMTEVYMGEREQWVRGAAAMRAAEVRALLGGARVDVGEVSRRLGYELDRYHVAYLVWNEQAERDPGGGQAIYGEMERVAAAVAESLGGRGLLSVPQARHLACWVGRREPPQPDELRVPLGPGAAVSVAAGAPHHGVEGFVHSHREAQLARGVAQLGGGEGAGDRSAACLAFPDVALDSLITRDLEAAHRFVARELGSLAGEDDATRRLACTLTVFLEEGCSFVRAARRLGVHANTVTYRVRRAEELLGRPAAERQLELRVALRLLELLPAGERDERATPPPGGGRPSPSSRR